MKLVLGKARRYFASGLIVFLPVALTIYLFILALNFADSILGKYIEPYFAREFGFYFQGTGIILILLVIFLVGFLVTNFLGRKIHDFFERIILKLPFFRQVYPAIKEISLFLFARERPAFKQVVLIEYPRKGVYSIGFLTNETSSRLTVKTGKETCNVFVPSAPGPLTGYVLIVPKEELLFPDVSVEDAVKFIVSGGVVNPV